MEFKVKEVSGVEESQFNRLNKNYLTSTKKNLKEQLQRIQSLKRLWIYLIT